MGLPTEPLVVAHGNDSAADWDEVDREQSVGFDDLAEHGVRSWLDLCRPKAEPGIFHEVNASH